MKLLISGASGLVGTALVRELARREVVWSRLCRSGGPARPGEVPWDPGADRIDNDALAAEAPDAVVHLAGESINGRWTGEKKQRIRESRVRGTRLLCGALARLPTPPRVLVSASAVGFYGNRGEEVVAEDAPPGRGFLAEVAREWEQATAEAEAAGIRVVHLRIGIVLSTRGGALSRLIPTFRWGLGGRLGSGRQWWPWIHIEDLAAAALFCLETERLRGPVNASAPGAVRMGELARTLGRVMRRPSGLPVPALALRLLFGEMAEALILGGARMSPAKLMAAGYPFRFPELEPALRDLLLRRI